MSNKADTPNSGEFDSEDESLHDPLDDDGWAPAGWEGLDDEDERHPVDDDALDGDVVEADPDIQTAYREKLEQDPEYQQERQNSNTDPNDELQFYIWEQLPGESDRAYAVFSVLRDTPPIDRTINGVARRVLGQPDLKHAPPHWWEWSSRFNWRQRWRAFDQWKHRRAVDQQVDQLSRTRTEIANQARLMRAKVAQTMRRMNGDEKKGVPPTDLTAAQASHWFKVAGQMEMEALGDTGPQAGPNLSFSPIMRVKVEVVFIRPPDEEERRREAESIKQELTDDRGDDDAEPEAA